MEEEEEGGGFGEFLDAGEEEEETSVSSTIVSSTLPSRFVECRKCPCIQFKVSLRLNTDHLSQK
jgi:hypothetical protein